MRCCVETTEGAQYLLAELQRKLDMQLKRCGLDRNASLLCEGCKTQQFCLTMCYCSICDFNYCASPRRDDAHQFFGIRCFEMHSAGCPDAIAKFPVRRCGDLDWARLGPDGRIQDCSVRVVRKLLERKLMLEGKWKAEYKQLKKGELVKKVIKIVNRK